MHIKWIRECCVKRELEQVVMSCSRLSHLGLLVNFFISALAFAPSPLRGRMIGSLLKHRGSAVYESTLKSFRHITRSGSKRVVLYGSDDSEDLIITGKRPTYTHQNLPEETLYILDGTSMIFTAHYRSDL